MKKVYCASLVVLFLSSCLFASRTLTMITDREIREIYESVDDPNEIFKKAVDLWQKTDSTPPEYGQAALNMMISDLVDRQQCISLGWAIQHLGYPDSITHLGYGFNEMGCIDPAWERLAINYSNKGGVELNFNSLGAIQGISYRQSPNQSKGWQFTLVSQFMLMSDCRPVVSGFMWTKEKIEVFRKSVQAYMDRVSEYEWLKLNQYQIKVDEVGKDNQPKPKEVELLLIDGLKDDLSRVIFRVKGRQYYVELYMDIWWRLVEGKWQPISEDEAIKMIVKPGVEQKSSGSDPNDK